MVSRQRKACSGTERILGHFENHFRFGVERGGADRLAAMIQHQSAAPDELSRRLSMPQSVLP